MHPQIVEAGERLTRRYVASGPHYLAMRMGQQHAREPNETMKCWVASYSGLGRLPLPNIGSMGGESGPQGRRHRGFRAPSVDPSFFV
jgi:hypothetical protein